MVQLIKYQSLIEKNQFIESTDFVQKTLLVPDLSSKLIWQNFLLDTYGMINGPQVLRAEDFWKLLVHRTFPEFEFVSNSWVLTFLDGDQIKKYKVETGLPNAKSSTILKKLNELIPIVCHPDSLEIMTDWFQNQALHRSTWEPWYHLTSLVWEALHQKKVLMPEWSSGFLFQKPGYEKVWDRDLLIDLGPEIRTMEVELLQNLSLQSQIEILTPDFNFLPEYPWIFYPYKAVYSRNHVVSSLPTKTLQKTSSFFRRLSTCVAEVKFSVGKIREWIESGIAPTQIVLFAPDIEEYWPALRWHLKKEGILFEKSEPIRTGDLGIVVAWLATLKKNIGWCLKYSELTLAAFHPLNYTGGDFFQHKTSQNKLNLTSPDPFTENDLLSAADFIEWAIQWLPKTIEANSRLYEILNQWLFEAQHHSSLKRQQWVAYLEHYLNQQEIQAKTPPLSGVALVSLMNGFSHQRTYQIFVGCSESQLKSSQGSLSGSDILSIQHHTGHLLPHPDRDFREFQLNSLKGTATEQFFTFPESDFEGKDLVPSLFWLEGFEKSSESQSSKDFYNTWNRTYWEQELLQPKTSLESHHKIHIKTSSPWTLSPASLQTYVSCPFRYFAEKGLKLKDLPCVDLDLDPRTNGTILHRLLELIVADQPFERARLIEKMETFVDCTLRDQESMMFSNRTRSLLKEQLLEFGLRFIEHEYSYRKEFFQFNNVATEVWFSWSIELDGQSLPFRGKIDRLDLSKEGREAIVIDYKNDLSKYRNSQSWLHNLEFQLPSYTWAVEQGHIQTKAEFNLACVTVVAAHYYSLKNFTRKGFTLTERSNNLVEIPTSKSQITAAEKEALLNEFKIILNRSAKNILDGEFSPIPHPSTECSKCTWRFLCRTPQPNL